ncbi:hypothetical protein ACH5RR_041362 [Cinchona calisaya]|uniref:LOB domain-containing protein n=1 Tax=Cinchona calisaya TaxID=153742 RepID=A0ABD2XXB3_9GENT
MSVAKDNNKDTNDDIKGTTTNPASTTTATPTTNSSDTRACAACKYQRRRCVPGCALAPYFPPDHQKQFLNAHRLFGLRNMMKIYKSVQPHQRDIAMKSMIFHANLRAKDPIGGCNRIIQGLIREINSYSVELNFVRSQLGHFQNVNNNMTAAVAVATEPVVNSEPMINPDEYNPECNVPTPQSMNFQADDFGSYADLYASLRFKDEDVEALTNSSPITSLVNGSEDVKPDLVESNTDLFESQNLNVSSKEDDQPKGEANNTSAQPKQEGIVKEANSSN